MPPAQHDSINTAAELADFCRDLAAAPWIAFDTEFVSEDTYRPQLCLVQVAAGERLAVIDPLTVGDMTLFWRLLAEPSPEAIAAGRETIVHAGREELLFCVRSARRRPHRLFDVQLAAGLAGLEYPAGYGSLMFKLFGERPHKGETRTDWRRRPLSKEQIEYALDDVRFLKGMRDKLKARLESLGRASWLEAEMMAWQNEVEEGVARERFWKVSGISGLSRRSLAIVRELVRWRDGEAERRDLPPRRILRDDLIVEIAKRRSSDPKQMRAVRGLERSDVQRLLPKLGEAVGIALALPDNECPLPMERDLPSQLNLLGQFLASALVSLCRSADIAASLVGGAGDVRELVAYRLNLDGAANREPPALAHGWRAEIVGRLIDDLLAGKTAIRIRDPLSNDPLVFDRVSDSGK